MSFKQCFIKVFMIFSSFEVWYISPLNTWKQQDLNFACFQGGKTSKFKSRKNRLKSTFSHFFFYRTYYFGKRHDMIQCTTFKNHFLRNTCNLRHSSTHPSLIQKFIKTYLQNGQWGMIKVSCGSSKLVLPNSELLLFQRKLSSKF